MNRLQANDLLVASYGPPGTSKERQAQCNPTWKINSLFACFAPSPPVSKVGQRWIPCRLLFDIHGAAGVLPVIFAEELRLGILNLAVCTSLLKVTAFFTLEATFSHTGCQLLDGSFFTYSFFPVS